MLNSGSGCLSNEVSPHTHQVKETAAHFTTLLTSIGIQLRQLRDLRKGVSPPEAGSASMFSRSFPVLLLNLMPMGSNEVSPQNAALCCGALRLIPVCPH